MKWMALLFVALACLTVSTDASRYNRKPKKPKTCQHFGQWSTQSCLYKESDKLSQILGCQDKVENVCKCPDRTSCHTLLERGGTEDVCMFKCVDIDKANGVNDLGKYTYYSIKGEERHIWVHDAI
ncbi:uncharacterized protein LOC101863881 [Aplysia californica]|uniref:Uncharacterized protein LOC101863881 n=1 Tax=Aplysia californica TaxID=6500 RepID=A0ABM0JF62_APLCA|nr:uncharacterized protein LOC101863881 [Aplysia californica]